MVRTEAGRVAQQEERRCHPLTPQSGGPSEPELGLTGSGPGHGARTLRFPAGTLNPG